MTDTTDTPTVAVPPDGPATVGGAKGHLGITDGRDDARLAGIVAAVNAKVGRWPVARVAAGAPSWYEPDGSTPVPEFAHVVEGATLLVARLFRRKNSPAGVETFGEMGAVYVQRNDPDVALLLGLGAYMAPEVG